MVEDYCSVFPSESLMSLREGGQDVLHFDGDAHLSFHSMIKKYLIFSFKLQILKTRDWVRISDFGFLKRHLQALWSIKKACTSNIYPFPSHAYPTFPYTTSSGIRRPLTQARGTGFNLPFVEICLIVCLFLNTWHWQWLMLPTFSLPGKMFLSPLDLLLRGCLSSLTYGESS